MRNNLHNHSTQKTKQNIDFYILRETSDTGNHVSLSIIVVKI